LPKANLEDVCKLFDVIAFSKASKMEKK